jgi:hypothetical protein
MKKEIWTVAAVAFFAVIMMWRLGLLLTLWLSVGGLVFWGGVNLFRTALKTTTVGRSGKVIGFLLALVGVLISILPFVIDYLR